MHHSNTAGQESKKPKTTLAQEVLSWPVSDILRGKRPFSEVEVKPIPKEFQTYKDYREAFLNTMREEIFYQIYSAMNTIAKGINVKYFDDCCVPDRINVQCASNRSSVFLCLPKSKMEELPSTGDVMLLSARNLKSRDQILEDISFCTILWVREVGPVCDMYDSCTVTIDALISDSPLERSCDMFYQVIHLANLRTDELSWQAMMRGFKNKSGIISLILSKSNNGPNGENKAQPNGENKASISEDAIVRFGLNQSQSNVVASCISAAEHSSCSVRLVWGPPGTGKTKTVSVILYYFLMKAMKANRVLVCAPTNGAIRQLTRHLISLLENSSEAELIQDIIVLGNEERLKPSKDEYLSKVHLKCRVAKQMEDEKSQEEQDKKHRQPGWRKKKLSQRDREDEFLNNAKLVICTPFQSPRVQHNNFNILVIDEAAYLKECESMIILAYNNIEHLVLIGDDMQLPSLVKSPTAEKANHGRSMFERLSELGYCKDLLNVQYRMHPRISKFPNEKFYDNKIIDGPNVKKYNYAYLAGSPLGPFSFIHVEGGSEEHTNQSFRNLGEADVAANIVYTLAEACTKWEKKTSVGIISQYTAQVTALHERIGNYQNLPFLSVQISTVDSFQGDEKDIIILSTVRHNKDGKIGFFNCHQRVNVALTRAKKCLWILGHEETLCKRSPIWRYLVENVKSHECLFNACDHNIVEKRTEAAEETAESPVWAAVHEADEEAEVEDCKIEHLIRLSQLSQTEERVRVNYKGPKAESLRRSLSKKRPNFYAMERTSRDGRFWSCVQEDYYTSVYTKNDFTLSNWIDWEAVKCSKDEELEEFEKRCIQVGLHTLLSIKQDWHEQTIRQFFSTFYIDPDRNFMTWMTGMDRKITVTKKFCQEVLLDPSIRHNEQRNEKLKTSLLPAEEEVVNGANGDLTNLILRVLDRSFSPRIGNRNNAKQRTKFLIYHFLVGKPFDFVDLMFSVIQETHTDTRRFMPCAPFIMLLINRATNEEFVHVSEGFKEHKVYNMTELSQKKVPPLTKLQQLDKGKPDKQHRVPPLTKRQRLR